MLTQQEQRLLIDIARQTLRLFILEAKIPDLDEESLPERLMRKAGVFVTLYKDGKLRGCIGRMEAGDPICRAVRDLTLSAATRDHRFEAVTEEELDEISIEISVLSDPVRIEEIAQIDPDKHGIYIRKGSSSGTFLPGVASRAGWDLKQLLGHCARDKARIGWNGWKDKDAVIYIYETLVIGEDRDTPREGGKG